MKSSADLNQGEIVALPGDADFKDGMIVRVINMESTSTEGRLGCVVLSPGSFCTVSLQSFHLASLAAGFPSGTARQAFERASTARSCPFLEPAAAKDPNNGDIQLLLTKSYLETNQTDAAVKSAEKAVAINPNNSEYHDWLGQAYGEKASHASMFSAYPLARKTQKEFETAVKLDERNFDATQHLIDYDCSAPSIVGGGDDKAQPLIQKLLTMDAAQGHYAQGNCRMQEKRF